MARGSLYSGRKLKLILNLVCFAVKCLTVVQSLSLSLDDIFDNHMLPLDVFLMRYQRELSQNKTKGFIPVLETMDYHRKMMQQFKASDYLIRQILNSSLDMNESRLNETQNRFINPMNSADVLLFDDGSTKYAEWLKKIATLEDIQRHLSSTVKNSKRNKNSVQRRIMNPARKSTLVSYLDDDDSDDGDITGYANNFYHNNEPPAPSHSYNKNTHTGDNYKQISKTGYENAHDDYRVHHAPPESPISSSPIKQIKEISLKDIADIALTTLAFLSFGMFALQVLMCITMSKDENSNLMVLPVEVTETTVTNDGTEEIRRRKRSVGQSHDVLFEMNKLSQKLMTSIEKSYFNHQKNAKHFFSYLCKYAAFGRNKSLNGQKIWATLQSFGASWLAARLSDDYLSMIKQFAVILKACG